MKLQFKPWHKILLTLVAFIAAIICFMVRLPSVFSHYDKELHTLFYFLAAAFLNILFAKRNLLLHGLIFGLLYVFGVAVEYAQQYSNTYFHKKIHGTADPEDVHANLMGLLAFSAVWLIYLLLSYVVRVIKSSSIAGKK